MRGGTYLTGETVPSGYPGTGWLVDNLPNSECSTERPLITQDNVNEILGVDNWSCLNNYPNGLHVINVPSNFVVQSPVIAVDKLDVKYFINETVPSGGAATVWLQSDFSKTYCP
ncbi:MAG: hypothetical protein BroJett018_36400 [Chloroflexota bacterium]|nr:MAG: hypothetical protein BroJett018_36400 [Chloroflexota bacterium]